MTLRSALRVYIATLRECAALRRPKGPIDSEGKMMLSTTADVMDAHADRLEELLRDYR